MTDVLSLSAQNIVIFEPVGNGWLSFGAKDLCMKVGETLDSQSFHLIFDDILHIISFHIVKVFIHETQQRFQAISLLNRFGKFAKGE